jgi:hypothetical protein
MERGTGAGEWRISRVHVTSMSRTGISMVYLRKA